MNDKSRKIGNLSLPPSDVMYQLIMARSKQILKGIKDKQEPDWAVKKMKPKYSKFHYHEALDRSCIILSSWEENVDAHPVVQNNALLKKKSEKILELMGEFYQLIPEVEEENESK